MSEQDVRDGLRGAVAEEPPLAFDPDALMATAQREIRRRRAFLAVGVATTAVAVAAVALPGALGRQQSTFAADRPAATGTASTTLDVEDIPWPPKGVEAPYYSQWRLRERGEEMRAHLLATLPEVLPGATDIAVDPFGGEAAGKVLDGQLYLNAFATFALGDATYGLSINAFAPGAETESPLARCGREGTCQVVEERDDGTVVSRTDAKGAARFVSALHLRRTGALVFVTAYNYDPTSDKPSVYASAVPVAVDRLARLATDPDLGL